MSSGVPQKMVDSFRLMQIMLAIFFIFIFHFYAAIFICRLQHSQKEKFRKFQIHFGHVLFIMEFHGNLSLFRLIYLKS